MSNGRTITIVGTSESQAQAAGTRTGRRDGEARIERVTEQVSVNKLRERFNEFIQGLEEAFALEELKTEVGAFELKEIQFSAELSASGDFKLLGTGVGVAAGSALTFVLSKREGLKAPASDE